MREERRWKGGREGGMEGKGVREKEGGRERRREEGWEGGSVEGREGERDEIVKKIDGWIEG